MTISEWLQNTAKTNTVRVYIANFFGFNSIQVQTLKKAGCSQDANGWYFDAANLQELNTMANTLHGFNVGGWQII